MDDLFDDVGLLLFAKGIVENAMLAKTRPRFVTEEIAWLSERVGCTSLQELADKLQAQLREKNQL